MLHSRRWTWWIGMIRAMEDPTCTKLRLVDRGDRCVSVMVVFVIISVIRR